MLNMKIIPALVSKLPGSLLLLIALILSASTVNGEDTIDDNATEEFNALIQQSQRYVHTKHDSARYFANEAIRFAERPGNAGLLDRAINNMGFIYYRWNELDSAETYIKRGLEVSKSQEDSTEMGRTINRLGNVYWLWEDQILAKNSYETARAVNNLANMYREWGDYQKAIQLYLKARKHYQQANYTEGVA